MTGIKTFTSAVLSSSDVNGYLMQQANIIVATVADITSPIDGMVAFETTNDLARRYRSASAAWEIVDGAGAWTSYTPSMSATGGTWDQGNASKSGGYRYTGARSVEFYALFVWGTTTTTAGGWTSMAISLPVDMASHWQYQVSNSMRCTMQDASGLSYVGAPFWASASTVTFGLYPSAGSFVYRDFPTSTSPVTWTTNDTWSIAGSYEAVG